MRKGSASALTLKDTIFAQYREAGNIFVYSDNELLLTIAIQYFLQESLCGADLPCNNSRTK